MRQFTFTFLLVLATLCCCAQFSIKGHIISQADTKPVANASVFLSNATIGDHTTAGGIFNLTGVKPGKYQLVISIVGFDTYMQPVTVSNGDVDLQTITIYPKSIGLAEVKITGTKGTDPERPRYMAQFTGEFLGNSDIAKECRILNPELIDFNYDAANNILKASSVDFLVIQNDALGYRIKYMLKDFTLNYAEDGTHTFNYSGSVFFEAMKGSPAEQQQWQRRRQEIYEGSQTHFFQSLIAGTIDRYGFRVLRLPANPMRPADSVVQEKIRSFGAFKNDKAFRDSLKYWSKKAALPKTSDKLNPKPLQREDILKGPNKQGLYALLFNGDALFISYNKYHHFNRSAPGKLSDPDNKDNTLVSFDHDRLLFDKNGSFINPSGLTFDGVWMRGRLATLLPVDYEPQQITGQEIDSAVVKKVTDKMNAYSAQHVIEKTYLHFDKPYYAAGDTMYFKAYLTQGDDHKLNHLSGILHIELIDPANKIIDSEKLQVTDGVGWGDFALDPALLKGNYRVRAYTQLMRNEGDEAFFDKTIQIGSTAAIRVPESGIPASKHPGLKPDLKFFPESGNLVAWVKCKIAFKAIAANGLGVDVKGVVMDNENNQIATFTSTHLGMGYFYLTPSETKTYTAKVSYPDGTSGAVEIPKAIADGITASFTDAGRVYNVKISAGKQTYQQNRNKRYTLVIYSGGVPVSYTVKLENQEVGLDIPKKDLHSGITTATLFSAAGEPLCERLLFVQNNDQLKLDINTDKNSYAARSNTGIKLTVSKASGEPVPGHFSVAVINESKVPVDENTESTIINNLLLTSDLKGYIEQPNYYFTNSNEKTTADLDLVMLTHGYRKYEWKQILNNNGPSKIAYQPEKDFTISGTVKFNGKPVENGKVKLFSKGTTGLMLDTITDKNGRFVFDRLAYGDTTKFVIQARTAKGEKDVEVLLDSIGPGPEVNVKTGHYEVQNDNVNAYTQRSQEFFQEQAKYGINKHALMLKEVVIKDKKKSTDPIQESENLNGAGHADQVITSDWLENSGFSSLWDALRGKLSGVEFNFKHQIVSRRAATHFQAAQLRPGDTEEPNDGKGEMQDLVEIIVDGIPVGQPHKEGFPNFIEGIDVNNVASVEFGNLHYAAIYGSRAAGGVLIITMKKKARMVNNYYRDAPGVVVYKTNGFYKAHEFYKPQYDHPKNNTMQDLRTTIYWNPELITDNNGNASFNYYNADGTGNYRVVVEGIDAEGNLGRQVYHYKVE
ncbi:MAG: carboxypeptidase regulatory-like domain-containing protein [Bacteroidota bacterium]|nr:carboxypeptidase regulatory-like domain-containing protein [Bacteroidota bacterium]